MIRARYASCTQPTNGWMSCNETHCRLLRRDKFPVTGGSDLPLDTSERGAPRWLACRRGASALLQENWALR